jgi:hypothetical protein
VPTGHQHQELGKRLARAMKRCGWQTPKSGRVSIAGKQCRGYWRDAPPTAPPEGWKEWKQWLKDWKDSLKNELTTSTAMLANFKTWHTTGGGPGAYEHWRRLMNGEPVCVRRDKSGYWYAFCERGLLGQAGSPRLFSTAAEARTAVDLCAASSDGGEWISRPD